MVHSVIEVWGKKIKPLSLLKKIFYILKCFSLDCLTMSWESKEIMVLCVTQVWRKKLKILH